MSVWTKKWVLSIIETSAVIKWSVGRSYRNESVFVCEEALFEMQDCQAQRYYLCDL